MPFYRGMRLARPAPGTGGGLSPDARAAFARERWIKLNAGNPRPIRAWAVANSEHVTSRNIARQRLHAPKPVTPTATVPNKRVEKKKSPPKRKDPVVKHGKEDHKANALVAKQRKVSGRKTVAAGNAVRKEAVVEKTTEDEPKAPARKRAKPAAATTHKNLPTTTTPGLTSGQRGDTTNDVAAATPAAFCWDEEHNAHLLEVVKDVKPAIGKDWDRVAQAFNDKFSATR